MIVILLVLAAILGLARFLVVRYTAEPSLASAVVSALAALFFIGYLAHPYVISAAPKTSTPGLPPPSSVAADVHDVSSECRDYSGEPSGNGSGFTEGVLSTGAGAKAIQPISTISRSDGYAAVGWASNIDGKQLARSICLFVDEKLFAQATSMYGMPRPDVAAASNTPALALSGFKITIPANSLPTGSHHISVEIISQDGSSAFARNSWDVFVR
jgi:hypothetical protein